MARTSSELKIDFVRWLDLLNKLVEMLLWDDEFSEGFSGKEVITMNG